jgi:hypothetical protein
MAGRFPMSGVQAPGAATVAGEPRTVCMPGVPTPDLGNGALGMTSAFSSAADFSGMDGAHALSRMSSTNHNSHHEYRRG